MEFIENKIFKNSIAKILTFVNKYYYLILGVSLFISVMHVYFSSSGTGEKIIVSIYWFAAITAGSEIRKDVKWIPFIILCIPFLIFLTCILNSGYTFWGKLLSFHMPKGMVVNLNPLFEKIPYNDASFARIYKSETLTWFMRLVYNNGFVTTALIPIYRALISKDIKKMCKYLCSAHVFQIFLITPFYLIFHLQEVWYVLGVPDGLARHYSPIQAAGSTLLCFPSMHTSISFAMFLLVIREKNTIFKFVWGFFCLSVIYSTMYLEIHWVIDVIGGLILAYGTVKLVDFVFDKLDKPLMKRFGKYYFRSNTNDFL